MASLALDIPYEFLRPLVTGWTGKFEAANRARQTWKEQADECRLFYNRSAAAMWQDDYARKFWKGLSKPPRFRISINLAYEYVAVFMPNLMWEIPHREVKPKRSVQITPELLGGEESEVYQAYAQEMQQMEQRDGLVSFFLADWLNYTPIEQPGGGLIGQSRLALLDALIVGRGCLWARPYRMEGSERNLTGCFYEPPERLLVDPDFNTIDDAKWISLQHTEPHWAVERRFGLEPNSLKGKASLESSWSFGESVSSPNASMHRAVGRTNDLVVWYEVWSKTGVGARMSGMTGEIRDNLEKTVGDYAYLAISPSVPYPLNCSSEAMRRGATPAEVKHKFSWPYPAWTDNRWPVEVLDFVPNTDPEDQSSSWPLPPLAPAMGEIKLLNFLIPFIVNRVYASSRDFWAIAGPHVEHYTKHLQEGEDQTIIPTPVTVDDVRKTVQILQQPEMRADMWRVVDVVTDLFRRRTGLVDVAYGMNAGGTQSRTAEDALSKREASTARAQQMQKHVVAWQSRLAGLEAFVTRWFVKAKDVADRYGQVGAMLWQQHIESTNVEWVVRQMQYSIAAASVRRPNRDRDIANFMQAMQYWLATFQQYASETQNYEPINGLLATWGELHDMEVEKLYLPPADNEQAQQMQQQQMELEQQKLQADLEKSQVDLQGKIIDAQLKMAMGGEEMKKKQMEMAFDAADARQELRQDSAAHLLDMLQNRQQFAAAETHAENMAKIKENAARAMARIQRAKAAKSSSGNGQGGL